MYVINLISNMLHVMPDIIFFFLAKQQSMPFIREISKKLIAKRTDPVRF